MFMFMTEKTYRFYSSLQQFISELMTEHDRLRAIYGDEHFTCYLGERSPDPLAMYIRPRKLIYWCNQKTSLEDHKVEMVTFYNLPSLDGENIKLRADILNEPAIFDGFSALARWQETESLWISKGLMKEIKADTPKKPLQPKPEKQKKGVLLNSVQSMLEKIAYRDYCIKNRRNPPSWSYSWRQSLIDKDTANRIDQETGGKIKKKWGHSNISGEVFANLLFKKYAHFTNLRAEWDKFKSYDFDYISEDLKKKPK